VTAKSPRAASESSGADATIVTPDVVYRWDLDKTYIQTDFHSWRGIYRAAMESAAQKKPVPGMRTLLQNLSATREARIIVVSGSPEMLRGRFEEMFALHNLRCDRLVLKGWAAAISRGRWRNIRGQVAYKLRAHIETRLWLQAGHVEAPEFCFGDDAEVDALIYCLYADACSRRVDATRLRDLLFRSGAYDDEVGEILRLLAELPRHDPVGRIFIHLDAYSPPARYRAYLGRVKATFNAFQIAVSLRDAGHAADSTVSTVADAMVNEYRVDAHGIAGSIEDAVSRGLCSVDTARHLCADVLPDSDAGSVGFDRAFGGRVDRRIQDLPVQVPPTDVQPLPYEQLIVDEAAFSAARRMARKTAAKIGGIAEFLDPRRNHR